MTNAIILHGKPSKEKYFDPSFPASSNYYWIPWLQKQLIVKGIPTATPEVPNNWVADYSVWLKEFERYDVDSETILIGHSCGAGFLLRYLSEHPEISPLKLFWLLHGLTPKILKRLETSFHLTLILLFLKGQR